MGSRAFPQAWDGTGGNRRARGDTEETPLELVGDAQDVEEEEDESDSAPVIQNSPDIDREIRTRFQNIERLQSDRKALNGEISAEYEKLKALGLRKDTAKYLLKVRAFDEDTRAEFELSERIMRSALGIPAQQQDLFTK